VESTPQAITGNHAIFACIGAAARSIAAVTMSDSTEKKTPADIGRKIQAKFSTGEIRSALSR
jgi:hypothetical protein